MLIRITTLKPAFFIEVHMKKSTEEFGVFRCCPRDFFWWSERREL
jgi:hypothetical protein